eukprot:1516914-Rhodomonas_salina.1
MVPMREYRAGHSTRVGPSRPGSEQPLFATSMCHASLPCRNQIKCNSLSLSTNCTRHAANVFDLAVQLSKPLPFKSPDREKHFTPTHATGVDTLVFSPNDAIFKQPGSWYPPPNTNTNQKVIAQPSYALGISVPDIA